MYSDSDYDPRENKTTSEVQSSNAIGRRRDILGCSIVIGSPEVVELVIQRFMEEDKKSREEMIEEIVDCLQKMGAPDLAQIKFITLEYLVKTLKVDDITTKRNESLKFRQNFPQINLVNFGYGVTYKGKTASVSVESPVWMMFKEMCKEKKTTYSEKIVKGFGSMPIHTAKLILSRIRTFLMDSKESRPFYYGLVEPPNPRAMWFLLNRCHLDIQKFIDYDLQYGVPSLLKTMFMPKTNDEGLGIFDLVNFVLNGPDGKKLARSLGALKQIICRIPYWQTEEKILWVSFYKPQPKNNYFSWLPKDIINAVLRIIYLSRVQDTTTMVENYDREKSKKKQKK